MNFLCPRMHHHDLHNENSLIVAKATMFSDRETELEFILSPLDYNNVIDSSLAINYQGHEWLLEGAVEGFDFEKHSHYPLINEDYFDFSLRGKERVRELRNNRKNHPRAIYPDLSSDKLPKNPKDILVDALFRGQGKYGEKRYTFYIDTLDFLRYRGHSFYSSVYQARILPVGVRWDLMAKPQWGAYKALETHSPNEEPSPQEKKLTECLFVERPPRAISSIIDQEEEEEDSFPFSRELPVQPLKTEAKTSTTQTTSFKKGENNMNTQNAAVNTTAPATAPAMPFPNFYFGPYVKEDVAVSIGGLAVKNPDTGRFLSYRNDESVDVTEFVFNMPNMIFAIPVNIKSIKAGDIILHHNVPMVVGSDVTGKVVEAYDICRGEMKVILPTKTPFGFNIYTKLVSMMDGFGGKDSENEEGMFGGMFGGSMMTNMMMMSMMSQPNGGFNLFGGAPTGEESAANPMMNFMMMPMMMKMFDGL